MLVAGGSRKGIWPKLPPGLTGGLHDAVTEIKIWIFKELATRK